ncbi:hypothetical protein [Streptomyces sp. NBC_01361]|uniref:hypothetical protein n=1 Tax=Streptomyces sp. NBC_01361 TaxID=2903838 RepID=UPI002E3472F1|nr:hypothetical protein [Streptomyces sp. NBC_01361]
MKRLYLVVSDLEAARSELVGRGVDVREIRHKVPLDTWQGGFEPASETPRLRELRRSTDRDGNAWTLQEYYWLPIAGEIPAAKRRRHRGHPT